MTSLSKLAAMAAIATTAFLPLAARAQTGADREPAGGAFMSSYARPPSGGADQSGPGLLTSTERRPYEPADVTTGSVGRRDDNKAARRAR